MTGALEDPERLRRGEMFKHSGSKILLVVMAVAAFIGAWSTRGADNTGTIQGVVKDSSGQPVSGAFVKLKNTDRRLVFMVITQAQGRYTANNLPPGQYVVQGVGGENQSGTSSPVDVAAGGKATVDLSLTVQRAPALPNAWPGRPPGEQGGEAEGTMAAVNLSDGAGKEIVSQKCTVCHDAQRIVDARADKERWQATVETMRGYMQGSTQAKPLTDKDATTVVDYLAANFSGGRDRQPRPKPDPNSRLPRTFLIGDSTNYVAVEYTLPNVQAEPHEVAVDADGYAWVSQRTGGRLGRLDPKSLTYTEMDPPAGPSKNRLNGIVRAPDGKLWFLDGGPNRRWMNYDTRVNQFTVYELPKLKSGSASGNTMRVHPNGTVWLNSIAANQVIRLDPATKEFTVFDVPSGVAAGKTANPYGMAISGDGYVWFVENAMNKVGRIDPETGKINEYDVPVPNSVPRKAGMDSEGNVWVGLHGAGKLMKIDFKTLKMTVYSPPTENAGVYSVQGDPTSKLVWFSEQMADKIARFDPQTQTFTEYPLPDAESDHRRIEIDPTNPNRIWWTGDTSARMGYIEIPGKKTN
jgi:virginiamycin B lyase